MAQHISVRVPWHDNGWNGTVCQFPGENNACLRLKNRDKPVKMKDYWESLASDLHDTHPDSCEGCCYKRRCLPCPREGRPSAPDHRNCRYEL